MVDYVSRPKIWLKKLLREADLPIDPRRVVGRVFCFYYDTRSVCGAISGIVTGVEVHYPGGDLVLYVSPPLEGGAPLRYIRFNKESKSWASYCDLLPGTKATLSTCGTLKLL